MGRLPRSALPSYGIYHVTSRGVDRCAIAADDDDRDFWLALTRRTGARFGWDWHAYCLLTNHFHLVVEVALERLSRGMHRLNGIYAQHFNDRHRRGGHLFGDRFHARVIRDDAHLEAACAYVRSNAARAGLCAPDEAWPWSGFAP